jgi:multiple sugar transport system ATP-binding protein
MNRFDGTLTSDGVQLGQALIRPAMRQLQEAQGHEKLVVGIRPEHLSVSVSGDLTVKVALVEDLGSDSFIYGNLADDPSASVIVRSGRDHPRPGEVIKVALDTSHLHLFDADSGERVGD